MENTAGSPATPPNHPIYQVKLSDEQVTLLVKCVFPNSELESVDPLGSGQSFNNRIYFLTLRHNQDDNALPTCVVLKVIGRFFSANKIQNEAVNLFLLNTFCPEIPAPEIVAWSEDGKVIHSTLTIPNTSDVTMSSGSQEHKWIMMTRKPGRIMVKGDLEGANAAIVTKQLADFVRSWRSNMPTVNRIGNFRIKHGDPVTVSNYRGLKYWIEGLLFTDNQPTKTPKTPFDYYNHLLTNQIQRLYTNDVFSYSAPRLIKPLETFQRDRLPNLPFLIVAHGITPTPCFTHQDLAPRNLLITDTPTGPQISGIVDFEFAGMFPQYEEYLNSDIRHTDYWSGEFWDKLLLELAARGVPVPADMPAEQWAQGCHLIELIESAAPWYLDAGHIQGDELKKELDKVAVNVEQLLDKLDG